MGPVSVFLTVYNALLWILWSVVLPVTFIIALRQWRRFNEEQREKEYMERVKLAILLAESGIDADFSVDAPMATDGDRHASRMQRLLVQTQMCNARLAALRPSPSPPDNAEPQPPQ